MSFHPTTIQQLDAIMVELRNYKNILREKAWAFAQDRADAQEAANKIADAEILLARMMDRHSQP